MKKRFLCLLIILIACSAAAAEVYKWTDANGVVHYSDTPGNNDVQIVELPNYPAVVSNVPAEQTSMPSTISAQSPTATPQEQQQAIAQQKQQEAYCEQAKANLGLLQETGRRVYTVSTDGQYHYFNDTERQAEIKKTQEQIKELCQPTK
ncbi:MAG: DUF4124 domain-containing protein [Gammaproteobacteria bacterium]